MTRNQMLELLEQMFNELREDFPGRAYELMTDDELAVEVADMRAYACARDLDADE